MKDDNDTNEEIEMTEEEQGDFVLGVYRSPMEVTISGNLAVYLRLLADSEEEIRGVNKIALDCIVESIVDRVKGERGFKSNEQAEAWLFDGCCDTGLNIWFRDDLDRTQ